MCEFRVTWLVILAAFLFAGAVACGGSGSSGSTRTIDDDSSAGDDDNDNDNDNNDASPGDDDDDDDDDNDDNDDDSSPGDDDDDDDNDDNDDDNDNDNDASPVDDDTNDSDQDGISDLQERLDGTDPLDPSDAMAWHPNELNAYPRLFADAAGWLAIKALIQAGDPDAVRLFNAIQGAANGTPTVQTPSNYDFSFDETNGQIAASAALAAFVLDDANYAAKALATTTALYFDMSMYSVREWDQGAIHGGMALTYFSFAFDVLAGFGLIDADQQTAMTTAVLNYAGALYHIYVELGVGKLMQNNHLVRLGSGLGITGMTFNMNRQAAVYVNLGLTLAPYILFDYQMPDGGGQSEGPYYFIYSMGNFLPLTAAYHRFAAGKSYLYKNDCRPVMPPCQTVIAATVDPAVDPRMTELLDWQMGLVLPDGTCPPFEDSNLVCAQSGSIAAVFPRPDYAWLYRQSPSCALQDGQLALLTLAFLPQIAAPAPPTIGPSVFKAEAGQATLRSGWGPADFYGLLTGEHGKARTAGGGHKHPDATSFMLYALGEYFAIDSGYGSYDAHAAVMQAANHNLILVDGQGPPLNLITMNIDVDAYLSEFTEAPPYHSARVDTTYQSAQIARRLLLVDNAYFVTSDVVSSTQSRTYAWLLQTLAGGDTDGVFTLESDGALIERPLGAMRVYLQSDAASLTLTQDLKQHAFQSGQLDNHAVLQGQVSAAAARYLAAYVVATAAGALPPTFADRQGDLLIYYVEFENYTDAIVANPGGAFHLASSNNFPGAVDSDAEFAWVRVNVLNHQLLDSHYLAGTYLNYTPQAATTR